MTKVRLGCLVILGFFLFICHASEENFSDEGNKRLLAWKKLIHDHTTNNPTTTLKAVNDFFNQLTYLPEVSMQGTTDIWQTPHEFLITGGGDCEDYAIAKYFTLTAMGIPENKLRITYVVIKNKNQPHMVLT